MTISPSSPWMARSTAAGAVVAIAATYVYFLLFAQFGFLHLLAQAGGGASTVRQAMASMGIAGLLASLATGGLLRRLSPRNLLRGGFAGCALSAVAALAAQELNAPGLLVAVAAVVGASTAVTTVSLAVHLPELLPRRHLGVAVGIGTGLAYGLCNVPALFAGSAWWQALASAAVALAGLGAAMVCPPPHPRLVLVRAAAVEEGGGRWAFASLLLGLLALVWLDSAAFAIIQDTVGLKGQTWGGVGDEGRLWGLGLSHLGAALLAGWLLDRPGRGRAFWLRGLPLAAFGLFVLALTSLGDTPGAGRLLLAGPLYAVGISFYSVVLVVCPALTGSSRLPLRWRAALLFGIAGWLGSALGVGMAQELHRIPRLFLVVAGFVLLGGFVGGFLAGQWRTSAAGRRLADLGRTHGATLALGVAALVWHGLGSGAAPTFGTSESTAIARGRQVYIAEGCIHCHSQYVRPTGPDVALWGPYHPLDRGQQPPLPGNRRQGPDLRNVGLRRSATWQRLHLEDPRSLTPGSSMPAYAHLFRQKGLAGTSRGDDLLAYLASLGREEASSEAEHWRLIQAYSFPPPSTSASSASSARGGHLFSRYCAGCHGAEARGDGPLAGTIEAVERPALDLGKGEFWLVSWGEGTEPLETAPLETEPMETALARLIKFGMPGTSMPGHEYLTDAEVADLVAFVLTRTSPG